MTGTRSGGCHGVCSATVGGVSTPTSDSPESGPLDLSPDPATGAADGAEPTSGTPGTPPTEERPAPPIADPLRGSRTSGAFVGTVGLGLILVLLIIFIAQNTAKTTVRFLVWEGQVSVAVALLAATAAGILLTAIAGTLRILQLRRRTKKAQKAQRKRTR